MDYTEGAGRAFRIGIRLALSLIFVLSLAVILTSVTTTEDTDAMIIKGDFYYEIVSSDEKVVELVNVTKEKNGSINIPQYIEDNKIQYTVIGVADSACEERKLLTSVTLPPSVTYIGDNAFNGCVKVNKINGLTNVSYIGENAFANCTLLERIDLYSDIISIKDGTFFACSSLNSVALPNTIESIGTSAFDGCLMLKNINVPTNLKTVGDYAFHSCISLTHMYLPDKVKSVGVGAYSECVALVYMRFPDAIVEIGASMFLGCTALKTFEVSKDMQMIGSNAFYECINLSSITISSKVNVIGSFAFYGIDFYNFQETQKITDESDLPGYTYVLKEPGVMIRQEIYAVHYNPNGGPNIADDEPHIAGQYFLPKKIETGGLICEDWIYNGKTYHYGEKIMMPGEDITLTCVWTTAETQKKETTDSTGLDMGKVSIAVFALGIIVILFIFVIWWALYLSTRRQ